jgi:CHAD domain-containing protein
MADRSPLALVSPDRPVQQCRDILAQQLGAAAQELAGRNPNIHGARKQLKRARATLRLLRPAIGDEPYRHENIAARDAARPLSRARDEEVLSHALEGLVERFGSAASGVHFRHTAHALLARQQHDDIKAALKRAMTRARAWQLDDAGWDCIETGLRSTYRRARHALRRGRKDRATEVLHEWRKQTKYLWHQLQLLTPLAPGPIHEMATNFISWLTISATSTTWPCCATASPERSRSSSTGAAKNCRTKRSRSASACTPTMPRHSYTGCGKSGPRGHTRGPPDT